MQDPVITPLLVSAGVASTVTIGGVDFALAATVSSLLTTTALVGAELMMTERQKTPTASDGAVSFSQPIPPVIWGVGRVRLAGKRLFFEERNGNLYRVNGIAAHQIKGPVGYYLGDDAVTLRADGVSVEPLGGGRYGYDVEVVRIWTHDGASVSAGDANPIQPLIDDFPGILTADYRPDRVAVVATRFAGVTSATFTTIYPAGASDPSVVAEMALVWDPRDPDQDPDDEDTWQWSANPVLIAIWYYCFCPHGRQLDYRTAVLPYRDHLEGEADLCDALMPQDGGGSAPRFECHFWWTDDIARETVEASILATCDGWCEILPDGGLALWVGVERVPDVWLDDGDISGIDISAGALDADMVNLLTVSWTDPQSAYQAIEADPFRLEDSISAHGVKDSAPDLVPVQNLLQARTIGWRLLTRANPVLQGTMTGNLGLERARGQRWIGIRSSRFAWLDGLTAEREDSLSTDLGTLSSALGFRVLDWTAMATVPSEGARHTAAARPNSDTLPVPEVIAAAPELVALAGGQTGVRIDVRVSDLSRDDLGLVLLWRAAGATEWHHVTYPDLPDDPAGGEYSLSTGVVAADAAYEVAAASLGTGGSWGVPSTTVTVSTSSATIAPASPVFKGATGGVGSATLTVRAPTSGNLASVTLWRALTGDPFSAAVQIAPSIEDPALGVLLTVTDIIAAGAYDYWATAQNSSGYSSTPTGPVTVTVS